MALVADAEEVAEVSVAEGVEHPSVHQVSLEGLRVLGQPHVAQPRRGHPVMVHLRGLGEPG